MEDDRISLLETQLSQARLIAEESDKKYEEVRVRGNTGVGLYFKLTIQWQNCLLNIINCKNNCCYFCHIQ